MALRSKNLFLWLCIYFCGLPSAESRRHVVASVVRLSQLAQFEQILVTFVRQRATQFPTHFVNFVSSIEEDYARVYDYPASFIDFPINQYRLIRRFSYNWPLWRTQLILQDSISKRTMKASLSPEFMFLSFYKEQSVMHNKIDEFDHRFDSSMAAALITRLHILHRNKTRLLHEEPTGCPPLSEMELLELCTSVYDLQYFNYALHWMALFIDRMKKYLPYSSVMFMIDYVLKHSDTYGMPDHYNHILTVAEDTSIKALAEVTKLMKRHPLLLQRYYDYIDQNLETQTCRSSPDRSEHGNYCFMFHSPRSPYAPFKYEILHRDPYVAVVHNFMPIPVARKIISEATQRGSSASKKFFRRGLPALFAKLSEATFLPPKHPVASWIDHRVEHATLLQPHSRPMPSDHRDGEMIKVVHYGLSGHYKGHRDFLSNANYADILRKRGDRVATVLVYLSDVLSGGQTAFPLLNVSWAPRAGSALVWFNLDPWNGTRLTRTLHTACPVNVGKKWVINRWIKSHLRTGHLLPVVK